MALAWIVYTIGGFVYTGWLWVDVTINDGFLDGLLLQTPAARFGMAVAGTVLSESVRVRDPHWTGTRVPAERRSGELS